MKLSHLQLSKFLEVYGLKSDALVLEDGSVVFDVRGQLSIDEVCSLFERFCSSNKPPAWLRKTGAAE